MTDPFVVAAVWLIAAWVAVVLMIVFALFGNFGMYLLSGVCAVICYHMARAFERRFLREMQREE